jgi:acetoin utilization protein AcuB
MAEQLVKDWMTTSVVTISKNTTLPQARQIMLQHNIRHLPVVSDGELVGIVTWGDIRRESASNATSLTRWELNTILDALPVRRFMTASPLTVTPLTGVARAAQIMVEEKIGGLPVMDQGRLVGIITESDILRIVILGKTA